MSDIKKVFVSPLVLFSIFDDFVRREDQPRVIGGLLGHTKEGMGSVLTITDSFPLLHNEAKGLVSGDYFEAMLYVKSRVQDGELVGWYGTKNPMSTDGAWVDDYSCSIQTHFMDDKCENPVHLVLDPTFDDGQQFSIKAFVSRNIEVNGNSLGTVFSEIPCEVQASSSESIALAQMVRGQHVAGPEAPLFSTPSLTSSTSNDLHDSLTQSFEHIQSLCDNLRYALQQQQQSGEDEEGLILSGELEKARQAVLTAQSKLTSGQQEQQNSLGVSDAGNNDNKNDDELEDEPLIMASFLASMSQLEASSALKLNELI
jgi:translation initiation factor 3 subunit F